MSHLTHIDTTPSTFTLTMDLSNEAMQEAWDVASALRVVSGRVDAGATSGPVQDMNGNTIGTFLLTRPAPAKVEDDEDDVSTLRDADEDRDADERMSQAARYIENENVFRVEYNKRFHDLEGRVVYVEAINVDDARVTHNAPADVRVVDVRRADARDVLELATMMLDQ